MTDAASGGSPTRTIPPGRTLHINPKPVGQGVSRVSPICVALLLTLTAAAEADALTPIIFFAQDVEVSDALTGAALPAAWARLVGRPDTLSRGPSGLPRVSLRDPMFRVRARLSVGLHGYETLTVVLDGLDPTEPQPIVPKLVSTMPRHLVGKVIRGLDSTPLTGVKVSAEGASTITDSDGTFALYDRCGTRSKLRAEFRGLLYSILDIRAGSGDTVLVNIALYPSTPRGAIAGKVINLKTRRPMSRALVGVIGQEQPSFTDSLGQFAFVDLPPGSFTMRLYAVQDGSGADWNLMGLQVKPAETTRVEFRYYYDPRPSDDSNYPAIVRVEARDALTGRPVRGAKVGIAGSGSWLQVNAGGLVVTPEGTRADALFVAAARGYEPSVGVWKRCGGDTAVVSAYLWPARPVTLVGELVSETDGNRLGNATVWVGDRSSRTDSQGRFTLTATLDARTAFSTSVRGLLYVTPRFRKLAGDTVHLTLRASAVFRGATLVGRVLDAATGGPLVANVVIEGTDLGSATDVDGVYRIKRVPPGSYRATASRIGYLDDTRPPLIAVPDGTDTLDFVLRDGRSSFQR